VIEEELEPEPTAKLEVSEKTMVDSRTDTEAEEVKIETIEINYSNVQDLRAPSEISPAVRPKPFPGPAGYL
jgi:hypothetical protein